MAYTPKLITALHNKSFALLWSGQSISFFGLAIYSTTLPFLVFHADGGAIELGLTNTFFILPQIIFLLMSGVYVDRWPRRRVLIVCDIIRGGAVLGISLLIITDALVLTHIYILTALMGFISTFYRPAVRGIIPQIVRKDQLIAANSLRSISGQVSEMVGPVVGGALVAAIGLYIAYSINAVTFLLSALFISFVSIKTKDEKGINEPKLATSFWNDFKDGWNAIRERAWLGASILIGSLSNIGIASFDVIILPVYAETSYNGVQTYGWFLAAMAIGALLCATIIGRLERISYRGILYYVFMALSGVCVLLLSLRPVFLVSLFLLAVIGFSLTAFIIIWDSAVQELVDEHVLGRVTSFQMFGGLALLPIGYGLFGSFIENLGTVMAMGIAGVIIVLVSLLGLTNKRVRQLN
ncbi:MFS family permease [Virgibacillus natechei]|uniref:MFS family permease n=1 Tax=Virgibacillus natechei TaxID=1216297 RepID=A0ABS4IH86_9BACI|nr:MFS transporter [Virgibacillus natechei]MBP1970318.1 MFS family permease [Virgibacillus natechei]UZD13145.1 MFS transporter [Virgibacillus natechei]